MPPPSSLEPAVGLKEIVWSSAVKAHSTLTVLSVSWARKAVRYNDSFRDHRNKRVSGRLHRTLPNITIILFFSRNSVNSFRHSVRFSRKAAHFSGSRNYSTHLVSFCEDDSLPFLLWSKYPQSPKTSSKCVEKCWCSKERQIQFFSFNTQSSMKSYYSINRSSKCYYKSAVLFSLNNAITGKPILPRSLSSPNASSLWYATDFIHINR